jgi:solute carrier family 10 (sodium/bile acid cotransporter), member 7
MLVAIALAAAAPKMGVEGGVLHVGLITQIGIALVFFLHGAALSRTALHVGAANWRLHALVQGTTFVLFPLLGGAIYYIAAGFIPEDLRLGVFYLSALSSTISSSVAMTALARGDVAAAVFNATLSGLVGMAATPILMGLITATSAHPLPWFSSILEIALKLLAPFVIGHLLRPVLATALLRHRGVAMALDRGVIVLIVYGAFCESAAAGLWSRYGPLVLLEVFGFAALLLAAALTFTTVAARRLRFSPEQEIAAVFCGSKKSLANGAPIAKILLGAHPGLGMIMLPLLIYHQLQLMVCSVLARRYAARQMGPTRATA